MIIPVRCFTCGKVVGSLWDPFVTRVREGEPPAAVLDDLGLRRYCCRRMLLSNADLIDEVVPFG
ncbi:MAG TPA: DNA-directed RNA polymerase subunit N [Thermoplasmata archaeon]|jgi:DNA-directed RNA polymerase subunit N|nr:DNA-directed RNA polymerase subunit N [Thermoplasmata archaeon]HLA46055.1 DNA-directed RNA polymerase subunit N [Thermoplasmata archaeon]